MATTLDPATVPRTARSAARAAGSGWAWAGAAAGVVALVGLLVSSGISSYDKDLLADNALLARDVVGNQGIVWIYQVCCSAGALGVAVFAAGLRRKLAAQAPAQSLLPSLATAGLASVALMLLVGGGICTELFWHLAQDYGKSDPDTIAANLAIFDTMGWVWAGLGLTTGSVAVAALRHGSLPRWLGWVSVVATVLIGVTQVLPFQYMAAFVGAPWLVAAGAGLARRERGA
jgi:hypothetical protein